MNTIEEFCSQRQVTKAIEDAFMAYVRSSYATRFEMKNGETVKMIVQKLTAAQVEDAWLEFVRELKNSLTDNASG